LCPLDGSSSHLDRSSACLPDLWLPLCTSLPAIMIVSVVYTGFCPTRVQFWIDRRERERRERGPVRQGEMRISFAPPQLYPLLFSRG
jgi:hypothetical protein